MFCKTAQRIAKSGAWSVVIIASILLLVACGGGGGVGADTPQPDLGQMEGEEVVSRPRTPDESPGESPVQPSPPVATPPSGPVDNTTPPTSATPPSLGKVMMYKPAFVNRDFLSDGNTVTMTMAGGGAFWDSTFPPNQTRVNNGKTTTVQYKPGNKIIGTVSVGVTGDYGNSVFIIDNAQEGRIGTDVGKNGVSVVSVAYHIHTSALTSSGERAFAYSQIEWSWNYPPNNVTTRYFSNPLDFFCERDILTVLMYLSNNPALSCGARGTGTAYRPNKSDMASGALQDIGARGFGFADTPARFYARWGNKEKRKQAGFSYNFDTFALRTDYNKLPAAQDAKVMLDTYRFGIMPDIGKRHRLFAGVDNYRNGILAIQYTDAADTNTHTNIYKLGSVAGKGGYAVKFEWRIVWD